MKIEELKKGMTVAVRSNRGNRLQAEYIGKYNENFVFRYLGTEECSVFTHSEVEQEVVKSIFQS